MAPASTDGLVLDFLGRRWRRRLDATTLQQAQRALALPEATAQRLRLYHRLEADRGLWRTPRRYGHTPLSLSLTAEEKLLARRLRRGASLEDAAGAAGLDAPARRSALALLRATGLLARGRPAPALADAGLQFHTVLVEGEHAFDVH